MTAAPEPRTHLALVAIHLTLTMVVAPQRTGTVTLGNNRKCTKDTFKGSLFGCFEYVPYTLLTVV